jgi:hypothetical protein
LGQVAIEDDVLEPFQGWLGLLSALSRFVDAAPSAELPTDNQAEDANEGRVDEQASIQPLHDR